MTTSREALPPEIELLRRAHDGETDALEQAMFVHGPLMAEIRARGEEAYGDLDLDDTMVATGAARVVTLVVDSEQAVDAAGEITMPAIIDTLVLRDVYLAEALVRGIGAAWTAFEDQQEGAFRSVRSHFSGQTPQILLDEIRDSVLGTFFVDGKVRTFRATAPIGAWARQIVFNLFRQRINLRRSGKEATALSQLGDDEQGADRLLPPSGAPSPPEALHRIELSDALRYAVPKALATLDRDEQRMLDALPTKQMTQIELAEEIGVSPFKLNRWYKEVRERFLRGVTRHVRERIGLDDEETQRLIDHLAAVWARSATGPTPISRSEQDLPQPEDSG